MKFSKWAFFRGYICTANEDGSIPINALMVADFRFGNAEEADRIVQFHNEMRASLPVEEAA